MSKIFTITEGLENMGALRTGGQGSVYKGRRMGPIITAVKLLPTPIYTESPEDKNYRNFINEVEKLKKVNEVHNPNVVKILSSGITESGSLPFIEMEFIEGPDLCELLSEQGERVFTINETIKLAEQLANALAHCHEIGIKHGDIKSNNVKLNIHSGNYVLLDFGLSVMSDEERRSSIRHAGAIEFMAPEQNEGQMLFQTDVYSFGVVLYELLTGQVPFPIHDSGETARNTVMIAHMEAPVPDLLELRKQNMPGHWPKDKQDAEMRVPSWLVTIVYKCLEKQPEKRYANGTELQRAVIQGAVWADGSQDNSALILKAENEQLQTRLAQMQEAAAITRRSSVVVPRRLLAGLAIVGALLLFLTLYALLSKKTVYQQVPVAATSFPAIPYLLQPHTHGKPVVIYKPVVDTVVKVLTVKDKASSPKKKRRRKKFLGIF